MKYTQQELKNAYQIVSQDLVHNLTKIKDGEGIRLNNLGTFIKTRQKIKDWEKRNHVYWRISFRASSNLKKNLK
ncbi:MAG: hypothetical protein MRERV_32c033 [Mycoplasmataceae bacterium RV_VA103A]|nr:MAG: hypothetical protein MRERV_32c033 [Mycoplasmataceae bacterium RV_VA103A]